MEPILSFVVAAVSDTTPFAVAVAAAAALGRAAVALNILEP